MRISDWSSDVCSSDLIEALARHQAGLLHHLHVSWTRTERGGARVRRKLPEEVRIRMRGIAVIEHDRAAGDQRREQQVPHHPAGGAVEKHHRIGAKIQMKMQQLQMLKQHADVTMDDGLGQANDAGRDHPPTRMLNYAK